MGQAIVVLEDNSERIAAMEECLADKFPFFERRFFRTAPAALEWLADHLPRAVCVSLDHDLEPATANDPDPGTGREVADFLAQRAGQCPVIIHSTNRIAAEGMEFVLHEAGWVVERVAPYDSCRWIGEAWLPRVRQAIVDAARSELTTAVPPG